MWRLKFSLRITEQSDDREEESGWINPEHTQTHSSLKREESKC